MKTIYHKLLSNPLSIDGGHVKAPEETGEHVLNLLAMLDSAVNLTDFKEKMEHDHYFSKIAGGVEYNNLVHTAGKLKKSKSKVLKSKYKDDIYVQVAQHDLRIIIEEAENLHSVLDSVYEEIYSGAKK